LNICDGNGSETAGVDEMSERVDGTADRVSRMCWVLIGAAPFFGCSCAKGLCEPDHRSVFAIDVVVFEAGGGARVLALQSHLEGDHEFSNAYI
jgi:hypothetical protein